MSLAEVNLEQHDEPDEHGHFPCPASLGKPHSPVLPTRRVNSVLKETLHHPRTVSFCQNPGLGSTPVVHLWLQCSEISCDNTIMGESLSAVFLSGMQRALSAPAARAKPDVNVFNCQPWWSWPMQWKHKLLCSAAFWIKMHVVP